MFGGSGQSVADTLNRFVRLCSGRNIQPEVAGDGVDPGCVQGDAAPVDGGDELPGAVVFSRRSWVTEKTGRKASKYSGTAV